MEFKSENVVDFGLCLYAREYYLGAQALRECDVAGRPYYLLLSLAIECYLKSIRTKTLWYGSRATQVEHTKYTHNFTDIFKKLEANYPEDANWLKCEYQTQYSRSFIDDLDLNKHVFTKHRYPYDPKGNIPFLKAPDSSVELIHGVKYDNDIAVYVGALEDVATFLYQRIKA